MPRAQAEKAARKMMASGYRHHTYEDERKAYGLLFHTEREEFIQLLSSPHVAALLEQYADVMGPTRMRALQNALICLIASICRMAIDEGVDVEFSFALSDYYINQLELVGDEASLQTLMRDILLHYFDLVKNEQRHTYSKPIASAVRYVGRNLYSPCTVAGVAGYVGLEPHYFSALFSKQVGIAPSRYIKQRKLEEARRMLIQLGSSVTEAAEALCFCDVAHFSRCFKRLYGASPSALGRQDMPRLADYER